MSFIEANYNNPTKLFNITISLTVMLKMKDLMKSIGVVLLPLFCINMHPYTKSKEC